MLSIQGIVSNLMDTYLERVMISRPTYPPLTAEAEARIAAGFPYALTADQQAAVDDVAGACTAHHSPLVQRLVQRLQLYLHTPPFKAL
jgi:transcription-repair coupling factor (superfamily II helicase)